MHKPELTRAEYERLRKIAGLTAKDVRTLCGVSPNTEHAWGRAQPMRAYAVNLMFLLAEVLSAAQLAEVKALYGLGDRRRKS